MVHLFFFEISKIRGAMSFGFSPSNHGKSQKIAILPLPMVIVV
jgi:hypothetical protein